MRDRYLKYCLSPAIAAIFCFTIALGANPNIDRALEAVREAFEKSKTPGLSGFILDSGQSTPLAMGVLSKNSQLAVEAGNPEHLFELASVSKAFTGLAVLLAADEGMLSLNDPVSKYLPWFSVPYKGQPQEMTIANVMYHTSGLTNDQFALIPERDDDGALLATVEAFAGVELAFAPGERYEYGTMNYDVLALIIQQQYGMLFEDFMQERIFEPLGLHNTYAGVTRARQNAVLAEGHKRSFMRVAPSVNDPLYRGNTAAGYVCTGATDMERWVRLQLGLDSAPAPFDKLIPASHIPDKSVAPFGGYYYAAGWFVSEDGKEIFHSGGNPGGFLTWVAMQPETGSAVCLLTNTNTINLQGLVENIFGILRGEKAKPYRQDIIHMIIIAADMLVILLSVITLLCLWGIIRTLRLNRPLRVKPFTVPAYLPMLIAFVFMGAVFYVGFWRWDLFHPMAANYTWSTISKVMPVSFVAALILTLAASSAIFIYTAVRCLFRRGKEKNNDTGITEV